MKKKRTKWIVIILTLIVIAVAATLLLGKGTGTRYAEDTAVTGNLTTYYNFSGTLDVDKSATLYAPADTTVSEIYVQPNAVVAKNARLMRLADGTILKADFAGEVTSLNVVTDSVVRQGDALMELMDLNSMKATFKVDEYDIGAITIGKTVQITVDGSGAAFEGQVTAINKRATQSGDLSYYITTVDLNGKTLPEGALPGMQITVDVLNQQVENAVLLRMDSVSFTSKNVPYVLMRDGDRVRQVDISVGMNDGTYVEVTGGLKSGETVLYTPTAAKTFSDMMASRGNTVASGVK